MIVPRALVRNVFRGVGNQRVPIKPFNMAPFNTVRPQFYSTKANKDQPKVRYLFYMFFFSSGILYFAGHSLTNKKPKTSFTEKEFEEYQHASGVKRRTKLISNEDNEKYRFYVVPYVHKDEFVTKLAEKLGDKEVRIIDPEELIQREKDDENRPYAYLLQDLTATGKPFPKGLITALIKEDIKFYLNTRKGTFDTNFIIKNYPQTTDEAIKFENDVSDIQKSVVLHYDILNELSKNKNEDETRLLNNVLGYFETVGKSKVIVAKHDELDDKLQDITLEIV